VSIPEIFRGIEYLSEIGSQNLSNCHCDHQTSYVQFLLTLTLFNQITDSIILHYYDKTQ